MFERMGTATPASRHRHKPTNGIIAGR
jgi:hypothetical protein